MKRLAIASMLTVAAAYGQEIPPGGPGPWSIVITEVSIVEAPPPKRSADTVIPVHNTGEPRVLVITFGTVEKCNAARNGPLNPTNFDIPLGTGGGGQAHVGRSVTECFQQ